MQQKFKDIAIDVTDFRKSAWRSVIKERKPLELSHHFFSEAQKNADANSLKEGKIFWLLGSALSMVLHSESINAPFKPFMIWEGRRSTIPEDFCEPDVAFFSEVCEEIDDFWLKGRLADLVWLLKRSKNHLFALMAIDAYRSIPLDSENWFGGGSECWGRAVRLTKQLRNGADNRLAEIENNLVSTVKSISDEGLWPVHLSDFLDRHQLGSDDAEYIANKLESVARHFSSAEDYLNASDTFDASAKWFEKAKKPDKNIASIVSSAEMLTQNADMRKRNNSDHDVAAHFYERAVQKYRSIPENQRLEYQIDQRINDLRLAMSDAGRVSVSQMMKVVTKVDIFQGRDQAVSLVQGKNVIDALKILANIFPSIDLPELRRDSEESMRDTPFLSMISSYRVSSDGRTVAKSGGTRVSEPAEEALHARMMRNYRLGVGLKVEGVILPALRQVQLEHRLSISDFFYITNHSPIVPEKRELLFAKGLFAGYDNDFAIALHLLVPQIENMVRWFLKKNDIQTTTLDAAGIDMEKGLSSLMELSGVDDIFGESVAFELKALFCDAQGANLRNEVAHGLLDDDSCNSVYAVYAWWLVFKWIFNSYCWTTEAPEEGADNSAATVAE